MNIEIANKLLQLRKEKGLSQEQLAQKLGISRQAISKWERAEASPDTDNLIELAKLYDISLVRLYTLLLFIIVTDFYYLFFCLFFIEFGIRPKAS